MSATAYPNSLILSAMADNYSFSEWLKTEMEKRDLSQSELARLAGVTRSAINGVVMGTRGPGVDLCNGIARAFHIPPEEVLRAAGMLPAASSAHSQEKQELSYLFDQLPPEEQQEVLVLLRFKAQRTRKQTSRGKNPARNVIGNS